ncbi:MAG TPA: PDZ domain-containing protein [Lacipirellulaceae bacterium]
MNFCVSLAAQSMLSNRRFAIIVLFAFQATIFGCAPAADVSAEFPITIYPDLIYVPVTIGASEHLCAVDSGAGGYIFHTTLRQELGPAVGDTPISLPDGSMSHAEKFQVPDGHIGAITLNKDALTLCYDLSSSREVSGRDIEGFIGLPLFQSYIVQLDFDAQRVVIRSPSISPQPTWGEPINLAYNKRKLPTVLVEFGDGITERCVVDTGYDGAVWLSSKLYARLLDKERLFAGGESPVVIATGARMLHEGGARYLKVGSIEMNDVSVRDGASESRIGLAFLRQFRVTLDIPHDRVYLAKGAEFDKPGKQRAVGIGLLRKNEQTVVIFVEPDSPAEDAGISINDELVTVAGERIAGRPLAEIKWMLREKADPDGKLKLVFRRGDRERKAEVTIRDPSGTPLVETANRPNREEATAIDEIQKLGGKVTIDEDAPGKPVSGVDFSDTHISDDALRSVEELTELRALILTQTQVTDAGLKHIEGLTQLLSLLLDDTRVTDAGLEHFKKLTHLYFLDLNNTQVTDAGLKQVGEFVTLQRLSLDNTRITDEGVKQLKGLNALWALHIVGTQVTPAGRKELKQALPNLQFLSPDDGDKP